MRILQLISQTYVGGAESVAFALSCELARRGHEVLLLSNRDNGPLFERPRPPGLQVRALDRRRRTDPRILSFLVGSIRRFRPDLIHAHNFQANTWARAIGLLFPRLPIFCHEHSGNKANQSPHRYWIDRLLFPRCSGVFAVSENVREVLERRHRVPPSRLHLLRNGIDVAQFTPPAGFRPEASRVVSVANLTAVKNHALLLQAWVRVRAAHPGARLTLVGDGPLRPDLERQARTAGIEGSVSFEGIRPDIRPYLWNASVFVLSSHWEAMPLSILEAMVAGLACVAPAVGGIPEILEDGVTGRLFPAGDAVALAAALQELLDSPGAAAAMSARARAVAARRYGLGACAEELERLYQEVFVRS